MRQENKAEKVKLAEQEDEEDQNEEGQNEEYQEMEQKQEGVGRGDASTAAAVE